MSADSPDRSGGISGLEAFLRHEAEKPVLRVVTCGSVDDGKSTLMGRLLYDGRLLPEDHLEALQAESRRTGTVPGGLDFALLLDGLEAEQEQGITIDVAYRFFATERRRFIVADAPGHEQYTANMITGASTADMAIILVDARKGILRQTRRQSYLASLLGIRSAVLAVNKMDLVGFDRDAFDRISEDFAALAARLHFGQLAAIPLVARDGDNVGRPSDRMPWYSGPSLMQYLDAVEVPPSSGATFRFPVQWVNRPHADFRGLSGTVAAGSVRLGDAVVVLPSGRESSVARILLGRDELEEAVAGQAVTLVLRDDVDAARGDVLASPRHPPHVSERFAAHLVSLSGAGLLPERSYLIKAGTAASAARIAGIEHRVDIDSLERFSAEALRQNEIGFAALSADRPLVFDSYDRSRETGSFILIDRLTQETVGAGMIAHPLRGADNIRRHDFKVDKAARAALLRQRPFCLWFTGLSGAGKSTIADLVEQKLHALGHHTYLLDGDTIRQGISRNLGFSDADRVENVRRVAEVARLFVDAGSIVLVSLISPFRTERLTARNLFEPGEFVEVFVDTPLEICEARDPKGLYRRARKGDIPNFTGIHSAYEPPEAPEMVVRTENLTSIEAAATVIDSLVRQGRIRL